DPPLPAGFARGHPGVGRQRLDACTGHSLRTIAQQPLVPVLVADPQRFADEQRAHSRAIDEQVALDLAAVLEADAIDVAGFRILDHLDDAALNALDTPCL